MCQSISADEVDNYVANQAYNRYSQMIPDIRRVQSGLETSIEEDVAAMEAAVAVMEPDQAAGIGNKINRVDIR